MKLATLWACSMSTCGQIPWPAISEKDHTYGLIGKMLLQTWLATIGQDRAHTQAQLTMGLETCMSAMLRMTLRVSCIIQGCSLTTAKLEQ